MAKHDPYWLNARFNGGQCAKCKKAHKKQDRIFYYPITRTTYCDAEDCGQAASRDFQSCLFDERGY